MTLSKTIIKVVTQKVAARVKEANPTKVAEKAKDPTLRMETQKVQEKVVLSWFLHITR